MASTIKVDNVQNQPGTNIINKCSTTITLGQSGDTINLASGATQTGFGRTGTVDWDTTIHTSTVTAVSGKGYFVNTTGGGITVNLPAASVGNIVSIKDYAGTFQTNACTIAPNGSDKIGGGTALDPTLTAEGGSVTLVYADVTQGWLAVQENVTESPSGVENFMVATGGTPCSGAIVCTNYKEHTFTGPGTFCVSAIGCASNNAVAYVVVAGGGGSVTDRGGAGGAGGFREGTTAPVVPYSASPLVAATGITVSASPYAITVGGGGTGDNSPPFQLGANGGVSTFDSVTSAGGGGGGRNPISGADGGSGGGGGSSAGSGNVPATPIAQGNNGGIASTTPLVGNGGGGGATAVGAAGSGCTAGGGGAGATTSINGTPTAFAGGGGGGSDGAAGACGGAGGGGNGGGGPYPGSSIAAQNGTVNTGGGAGGANGGGPSGVAKDGGSGIVIIRYKFQ